MRRPTLVSHRSPRSISGHTLVSTALLLGLAVGCPMGAETTDPAAGGQNASGDQMTGTGNSGGSAGNSGDSSQTGAAVGGATGGDPVVQVEPPAIAGSWKGKNVWEFTQTTSSPTDMTTEFSFESDFEIAVGDDGRPGLLTLPLFGQGGASGAPIEADIFDVGMTKQFSQTSEFTANGETTMTETVSEITVRKASFTENGFRVAYDFEMTSTTTGGQVGVTTQRMSGSSTYEAELAGGTLAYTQTIVQDMEVSFGDTTQSFRQEGTGVATLTRQSTQHGVSCSCALVPADCIRAYSPGGIQMSLIRLEWVSAAALTGEVTVGRSHFAGQAPPEQLVCAPGPMTRPL